MTTTRSQISWLDEATRLSPWSEATVVVAGIGLSGYASADALIELGARVIVVDDHDTPSAREKATILTTLGAEVRLGPGSSEHLPEEAGLVVASPGWPPSASLLKQALAAEVPIWGEVELAWRLQQPDRVVPWLAVTGTNGKTTTVGMLESILRAADLKVAAVGNVGRPIIEAILDEETYDVFAVELSSFQLHWAHSLSLHSAAVLNVAPDHLEWYADSQQWTDRPARDPESAYAADKAEIYHRVTHTCVYNDADPRTEQMVIEADVVEGARAVGFTLAIPAVSMVGVVDGMIVDRAFIPQRRDSALEIIATADLPSASPAVVADALAATALARSFGVAATAVRDGLRSFHLGLHRVETVAVHDGVRWVDDSKATNPAAAEAALAGFDSVVWIAGGQAKGVSFDELVGRFADRIRAAVLFGVDRQDIADAFARRAPQTPLVVIDRADPAAMDEVVAQAARLARSGDTVLLAPACASKDMFTGYDARGDAFAAAVATVTSGGAAS
ncbi:MAG: UDP-N-acetylmuramoyl-L-alanine--D-glutamate ligase [Propionibacteriaceae bacterium]|jgi:UDP-N-acetylmuramoylalanine--D-glutamate ligase|nr:UDP-N-acetylmuramoyl-L-alanine--D-glutamate ligase [Propionibacteriaceae bacterium]